MVRHPVPQTLKVGEIRELKQSFKAHSVVPNSLHPHKLVTFICFLQEWQIRDFPGGSDGKASVYNAGDLGSILGLGRFSGEGNSYPLEL